MITQFISIPVDNLTVCTHTTLVLGTKMNLVRGFPTETEVGSQVQRVSGEAFVLPCGLWLFELPHDQSREQLPVSIFNESKVVKSERLQVSINE